MAKRKVSKHFRCNTPHRNPVYRSDKLIDNDVLIGLEIETENTRLGSNEAGNIPMWNLTLDHSLKSSTPYEFIFANPLSGADVENALSVLASTLDRTPVRYPHNTSVHVHVDVSDMDIEELRTFLYLAITFESALIQTSGNRRNNVFCMQIGAGSTQGLREFGEAFDRYAQDQDYVLDVSSRQLKYAAVNPMPILSHGTLEFRTHEGTHDPERIIRWLNILLALRRYAVDAAQKGPAMLVVDYASRKEPLIEFMREIWEEDVVQSMLHENLHHDVTQSSLAARMALYPKSRGDFWEEFTGVREETPQTRSYRSDLIREIRASVRGDESMRERIRNQARRRPTAYSYQQDLGSALFNPENTSRSDSEEF